MNSLSGSVRIVRVDNKRALGDWLAIPHAVFEGDPAWVPPLDLVERRRVSRKHAPFFSFGDASLFVAYRGEKPIGRISAHVNRRHLEYHGDATGHFGFFDCANDPDAGRLLVSEVATWLRQRGLKRMIGPVNFTLNEECGCLISGFETPPAVLMTHARPWTASLLEGAGLTKEIDLFAYRLSPSQLPQRVHEIAGLANQLPGVSVRRFDMSRYADEVRTLTAIFNDAWSNNWGFVPFSEAEIDALLAELRPLLRGEYGRFVCVNGETVGVIVAIPNVNEIIARFNGRLLPFNWAKLLWTIKMERTRTARIPLLGLKRQYQSTPIGGMLLALMVRDLVDQVQNYRMDWVEFSWILETNTRMVKLAEMVAGSPAKTYRLFTKMLQHADSAPELSRA